MFCPNNNKSNILEYLEIADMYIDIHGIDMSKWPTTVTLSVKNTADVILKKSLLTGSRDSAKEQLRQEAHGQNP